MGATGTVLAPRDLQSNLCLECTNLQMGSGKIKAFNLFIFAAANLVKDRACP